jgi:hypothetical protein
MSAEATERFRQAGFNDVPFTPGTSARFISLEDRGFILDLVVLSDSHRRFIAYDLTTRRPTGRFDFVLTSAGWTMDGKALTASREASTCGAVMAVITGGVCGAVGGGFLGGAACGLAGYALGEQTCTPVAFGYATAVVCGNAGHFTVVGGALDQASLDPARGVTLVEYYHEYPSFHYDYSYAKFGVTIRAVTPYAKEADIDYGIVDSTFSDQHGQWTTQGELAEVIGAYYSTSGKQYNAYLNGLPWEPQYCSV